jgi:multicomponent K+:H+ antiporter subunit G
MNTPSDLPLWAAWAIVAVTLCGSLLALTGSVGLVVLKRFYERVHAPTLGATLGMALIVLASVSFWSLSEGRLALKDVLIGVFLTVTTPVTLILLARAAVYRDRVEGQDDAPPE